MSMRYYLYKIVNAINEKVYIGITNNPYNRWKKHRSSKSVNTKLKNAMQKHGVNTFKMEILCVGSRDYITELEMLAISSYDSIKSGYNILSGSPNSINSPEFLEILSNAGKKNKGKLKSPKILENPIVIDGIEYSTRKAAVEASGLPPSTFDKRRRTENLNAPHKLSYRTNCHVKKPIMVCGVKYNSVKEALESLEISRPTLLSRIKTDPENYFYVR